MDFTFLIFISVVYAILFVIVLFILKDFRKTLSVFRSSLYRDIIRSRASLKPADLWLSACIAAIILFTIRGILPPLVTEFLFTLILVAMWCTLIAGGVTAVCNAAESEIKGEDE